MASTIAHEINNPLEAVTNLLYLAQQTAVQIQMPKAYLATAEVELRRVCVDCQPDIALPPAIDKVRVSR